MYSMYKDEQAKHFQLYSDGDVGRVDQIEEHRDCEQGLPGTNILMTEIGVKARVGVTLTRIRTKSYPVITYSIPNLPAIFCHSRERWSVYNIVPCRAMR